MATTPASFVLPDFAAVQAQAAEIDTRAVLQSSPGGPLPSSLAAAALALFNDQSVSTEELKAAAEQRLTHRRPKLHTFVPLYTTNHCDSECKMCGMRKGNKRLERKFAGKRAIEEQLHILYEEEGIRGVGFLTGEYSDEYTRLANAFRIGWAIRCALDIGFQRIYYNIGSMEPDEIEVLGEWISRDEPVTMCVFQETYNRVSYARFMGSNNDPAIPKADYDRRIASFDRWLDAGFRYVNPGALVGLHYDAREELVNLVAHVDHLVARGGEVDVSMPRMRPASGTGNVTRVGDEPYLRMIATIAFVCPDQRVVLTNREGQDFQDVAIGLCGVFSPGSPDVAPYRRTTDLTLINAEGSSQFLVADLRRPRDILGRIEASGRPVEYFEAPEPIRTPQPLG